MDIASLPLLYILGVQVAFTPCFFPIVPVFLTYIIRSDKSKVFLASLLFALGIISSFILYGLAAILSASLIQVILKLSLELLMVEIGIFLIAFGLSLLTPFKNFLSGLSIPAPRMRKITLINSYVFGFLFSIIAAPCASTYILAFLSTIFVQAISGLEYAVLQLSVIGAGIGTPFIAIGLIAQKVGTGFLRKISSSFLVRYNEEITGIITALMGVFVMFSIEDSLAYVPLAFRDLTGVIRVLASLAMLYYGYVSVKAWIVLGYRKTLFLGSAFVFGGTFLLLQALPFINVFHLDNVVSSYLILGSRFLMLAGILLFYFPGYSSFIVLKITGISTSILIVSADLLIALIWLLVYTLLRDGKRLWGTMFFLSLGLLDFAPMIPLDNVLVKLSLLILEIVGVLNFFQISNLENRVLATLSLLVGEEPPE